MITFGFLCLYWSRVIVRELCIIQSFYFIIIDEIEVSGVSVGCGDNHWWRRQPPRYDTERATFIRNGGELTQQSRSYITIPVISGLYRRPDQTQHLLHIRRCHRRRLCNIWLACSNVGRWVRSSEWGDRVWWGSAKSEYAQDVKLDDRIDLIIIMIADPSIWSSSSVANVKWWRTWTRYLVDLASIYPSYEQSLMYVGNNNYYRWINVCVSSNIKGNVDFVSDPSRKTKLNYGCSVLYSPKVRE